MSSTISSGDSIVVVDGNGGPQGPPGAGTQVDNAGVVWVSSIDVDGTLIWTSINDPGAGLGLVLF